MDMDSDIVMSLIASYIFARNDTYPRAHPVQLLMTVPSPRPTRVHNELMDSAENIDGTWTFKDANGTIRDKTTLKPMTAREIQLERYKDLIEVGKEQKGTGGKTAPVDHTIAEAPATVTTKVELSEWIMKDLGHARGTKEYTEIFDRLHSNFDRFE